MSRATSTKLNRLWRLQEQVYGCWREGWGIGIVRELGMDMYTLLYLKWINKDLAQETLLNVMWQPGWEGSLEENQFSSVQFSPKSCPTLRPHGLQDARLPCPSPILGACSNSCPLSWWCHPTISSSVTPFSSCLQSCPASRSFPMS